MAKVAEDCNCNSHYAEGLDSKTIRLAMGKMMTSLTTSRLALSSMAQNPT